MKQVYKHSVFIVDDDQDDREAIRDAFLQNRHDQDYFFMKNGEHLVEQLYKTHDNVNSSIVLLDLNMPGKDGKDLLRDIKGDNIIKCTPIIVFTTSSSERDRQLVYELGANCFVTKPDTFKELMKITDSIARLWFLNPS